MPRGKAKAKPTAEQVQIASHAGWLCGVCGEPAVEDDGFTRIDPRYSVGSCEKHSHVGLYRPSPVRARE